MKTFITALLAATTLAEITADGPWTGYDIDESNDIAVVNGIVTGTGDKARMIESAKMRSGDMSDYATQDNVKRVADFITQEKWDAYFPSIKHTKICSGSAYNRTGFLKAVAKFPKFCGENKREGKTLLETCKREVAALFAHFAQETGKNSSWANDYDNEPYWKQGLCKMNENTCPGGDVCDNYKNTQDYAKLRWPEETGQTYYGRGPFQLSYPYNYGRFSNTFYEDDFDSRLTLVETPNKVAEDGYIAMAAALWFYMTPQSPKPSMHEIMSGYFEPNTADTDAGIKGQFGSTINVINGDYECGTSAEEWGEDWKKKAVNRGSYFKSFLNDLGLDETEEDHIGCVNENSFPAAGAASVLSFIQYDKKTTSKNKCDFVAHQTGYSIFDPDDYKRCVCDHWGNPVGESECPQA